MWFNFEVLPPLSAALSQSDCSAWMCSNKHQKFILSPWTAGDLKDTTGIVEYNLRYHDPYDFGLFKAENIRFFNTEAGVCGYIPIITFKDDKDYIAAKLLFG